MNGKKLLSIALSTLLTLSLAAPALAADLPEGWTAADGARVSGPWYAEAVDYVQEKGYMVGTDQGFEPEAAISAAQILQTLFNREGKPDAAGTEQPWYADAVAWADGAGYQTATIADLEADADRILIAHILKWYGETVKAIPITGNTEISTLADYDSIYKTDYPYIGYCMNTGLMVGNQDNEWAPHKTLTRAEFATILMRLDQVDPPVVTLADYLAQGGQEWFLTGKTEYTIQGMLVSKDTPYENVLEGNAGVVTDDGVTVLLKGTVDELWPSKLEKVMKTYTKADGTELTAKDFEPKDTYIDLKTKAQPGTNFAMFIPADIQVVVETAWGDILTANRPGVEHGKGDYLVSTVKDGQPDLTDVWVLNGAVFPNTYDLTNAPATEAKYHVAVLVPNPTDGSYFEAGVNGAKALADTEVDAVAMGAIAAGAGMPSQEEELAHFRPFFTEAAQSGKYDLILTAGAECTPAMLEAAKAYPDQKFMSYDLQFVSEELEKGGYSNVYGVTYKNQDLGYLAGFIASQITVSDMEKANADKKIGIILGMDVPGLNDYAGSFCQAAKEQGVTVYVDYVGDFLPDLAPTAAEKAKAMYDDGVDVIWQVAGGAGKGVFTAAKEAGRYALGVDCDQTLTVSDPDEAATIVTSFYANSPAVIADAWEALLAGQFPGGTYPTVGLAEGYVGFADNEQFEAMTSQALRDAVAELFETMAKGETQVFQASADAEAWARLKADVAP